MAAYAALVSLFNDLELIPNHPIHSFYFDHQQISSLYQTVEFLIDFMETYDSHGCNREAAWVLESKIASAAHAALDVIGSHVVDQVRAGSSTRGGKVKSYFLLDLHKAIGNMEFVKRKVMQFKAKSGLKVKEPTYSAPPASSVSLKDDIVGFHDDVEKLVQMLIGEPANQRLVIPIAGMGGSGKTSLVKIVYEHSHLEHHFDVRLWATISQQYSAERILAELYGTGGNVRELGEQVHKRLWGRRYLVVLDDMWDEGAWDEVNRFLPDNGNGSRVVVTTRLLHLACHLNSSPYRLNFLDDDMSWELFCRKAFGEEDCPLELEEIGKKIVQRCKGLPLSIVVIGGHLKKFPRAIEHWEKIANLMNPIMSIGEEEQCLDILRLSYEHLPTHLKPCFLYMGIFREDQLISASKLINFWIAEGFLKPKKGISLEEVGEDYLMDLINMNLILVDERSWNGKVERCKIHDTVRELCLEVCKKEKFLCVVEDTTQATSFKERRLVIQKGRGKLNFDMTGAMQSATLLHSLVHKRGDRSFLNKLYDDCKSIRVLVHKSTTSQDTCLPPTHFQPVNLRALVFNHYGLYAGETTYAILLSISACWNLQVIMIHHGVVQLPFDIWNMTQLRHLSSTKIYLSDYVLVDGLKQQECIVLQNLYTLKGVVDLRLSEEVCKRIPNLKNLEVSYHSYDDYCFHNLSHFNKLRRLKIYFCFDSKWCDDVLSLTFPDSLEELILMNGHLKWEDLTMMLTSLPHLGFLELHQVCGSEWKLDGEEFSCLKSLDIYDCEDLIYLNANSSHFPVLKSLYISGVPRLNEIPLDFGEIPTLELIQLVHCSAYAAFSAMEVVIQQEANGNHDFQLHVSFWKDFREECDRFQEMLREKCLTSCSLHLLFDGNKIRTF